MDLRKGRSGTTALGMCHVCGVLGVRWVGDADTSQTGGEPECQHECQTRDRQTEGSDTGYRGTWGLPRLVFPAVVAYVVRMYRIRARLFARSQQPGRDREKGSQGDTYGLTYGVSLDCGSRDMGSLAAGNPSGRVA